MTLTQYLNQKDPVWFPTVVIKEEELNMLDTIYISGEKRSLVTIKSDNPIVKDLHYCLVGGRLWVMDEHGNPRARSVFTLK